MGDMERLGRSPDHEAEYARAHTASAARVHGAVNYSFVDCRSHGAGPRAHISRYYGRHSSWDFQCCDVLSHSQPYQANGKTGKEKDWLHFLCRQVFMKPFIIVHVRKLVNQCVSTL